MPVVITATILSGEAPAPVQVTITGMTVGDEYTVRGNYESFSWPVPGGTGTSDGEQLVLIDNRAPLNGAIVYTVTIDGVPTAAPSIVLTVPAFTILQTLDGTQRAAVEVADPSDERAYTHHVTLFQVAGRPDPVARIDVPSTASMQWPVEAEGADAEALKSILSSLAGTVLVRRDTVGMRDIRPVEIVVVTNHSDRLIGYAGTLRLFTLDVQAVGDPEPFTALAAFSWADFDAAWAGLDWDDFDTEWAGFDWDDSDRHDYGS